AGNAQQNARAARGRGARTIRKNGRLCFVHAQSSRRASIAQCLDGGRLTGRLLFPGGESRAQVRSLASAQPRPKRVASGRATPDRHRSNKTALTEHRAPPPLSPPPAARQRRQENPSNPALNDLPLHACVTLAMLVTMRERLSGVTSHRKGDTDE